MIRQLRILVYSNENEPHEYSIYEVGDIVAINDVFIRRHFSAIEWETNQYHIGKVTLDCSNSFLTFDNLSYLVDNRLGIFSFSNTDSSLRVLKCNNVDVHLVGVNVKHIEICNGNVLIADINSNEVFLDFKHETTEFNNIYEETLDNDAELLWKKLEFRRVTIKRAIYSLPPSHITVIESTIDELSGRFMPKNKYRTKLLNVIGSDIKLLDINGIFEKVRFYHSFINRLFFDKIGRIHIIEVINTDLNYIIDCSWDKITDKNLYAYEMIQRSNHRKDVKQYANAGFMHQKLLYDKYVDATKHRFKKIMFNLASNFLRLCNGYGFKPVRALLASIVSVFLFGVIFLFLNTPIKTISFLSMLENLYLSGLAFTTIGFAEFGNPTWICRVLMIVEGGLGVAILALFISALQKKYSS